MLPKISKTMHISKFHFTSEALQFLMECLYKPITSISVHTARNVNGSDYIVQVDCFAKALGEGGFKSDLPEEFIPILKLANKYGCSILFISSTADICKELPVRFQMSKLYNDETA